MNRKKLFKEKSMLVKTACFCALRHTHRVYTSSHIYHTSLRNLEKSLSQILLTNRLCSLIFNPFEFSDERLFSKAEKTGC